MEAKNMKSKRCGTKLEIKMEKDEKYLLWNMTRCKICIL